MSLGSLVFYATRKKSHHPSGHHTLLHASVPFIAATVYLAMAFGIGTLFRLDGSVTYLARYLDWSVTTPILLSSLVLLAFHEHGRTGEVGGHLTAIIVLDELIIATGLVSSLAGPCLAKLVWYAWSCVAFLGVLYLWVPLRTLAQSRGTTFGTAYNKNVAFLTTIWFLYPIVSLIGPEGMRIITDLTSVWAILIMDVVSKVVHALYRQAIWTRRWSSATTKVVISHNRPRSSLGLEPTSGGGSRCLHQLVDRIIDFRGCGHRRHRIRTWRQRPGNRRAAATPFVRRHIRLCRRNLPLVVNHRSGGCTSGFSHRVGDSFRR